VRGLNKKSKRLRISNLLRDWKVYIICLQETKVHGVSRSFCAAYGVVVMWTGVVWTRVGP
jgi:exonuclease III